MIKTNLSSSYYYNMHTYMLKEGKYREKNTVH